MTCFMLMKTVLRNLFVTKNKHFDVKLPLCLCRECFDSELPEAVPVTSMDQPTNQPLGYAGGGSTSSTVGMGKRAWKWSTRYLQAQVALKPIACGSCFGKGFLEMFLYMSFFAIRFQTVSSNYSILFWFWFCERTWWQQSNKQTHNNVNYDGSVSTYQQYERYKHISQFILNFLYKLTGSLWSLSVHVCLQLAYELNNLAQAI